MGVHSGHVASAILNHNPDWLAQVAVIRNHYGASEIVHETITDKIRSKVHVRAFLFSLQDLDSLWHAARRRICLRVLRQQARPPHEMAEMNTEVWQRTESSEVRVLTGRSIRIVRTRTDHRSEIPYTVYGRRRCEATAESIKIKPLVLRASNRSVVEVEPVDIDVDTHCLFRNAKATRGGGSAPCIRRRRGDNSHYANSKDPVCQS